MQARQRLLLLSEKILEEMNMELVEMDFFNSGSRKIVRLYIDKENGVTVADCSKVSHQLSIALEVEDLMEEAYHLEVSSPGIDRPLKTLKDYQRNTGKLIRVSYEDEVGSPQILIGKLIEMDEFKIQISIKKNVVEVPLNKVLLAKVEVQI